MSWSRLNVFVNAPIDKAYEPLFEALVFAIYACGYRARTALEESDSGDIRIVTFLISLATIQKRTTIGPN